MAEDLKGLRTRRGYLEGIFDAVCSEVDVVVERRRAWTRLFWMSVAALDEVVLDERRSALTKSAGL